MTKPRYSHVLLALMLCSVRATQQLDLELVGPVQLGTNAVIQQFRRNLALLALTSLLLVKALV